MSAVNDSLRRLAGRRIPGGCDDCDAYQVMTEQADNYFVLAGHHDDSCPFYAGVTK